MGSEMCIRDRLVTVSITYTYARWYVRSSLLGQGLEVVSHLIRVSWVLLLGCRRSFMSLTTIRGDDAEVVLESVKVFRT